MENVRIQTPQNVAIDFEVAGLGDRVIAALIDYMLLISYLVGMSLVAVLADNSMAVAVVLFLPYFLYFLICEVFLDGQSIGKRTRQLKVVRLDGSPPTLGNYVVRWLLRFVEVDLTMGAVALVTVFVNGQGQRLGDLAAGTTVVKIRPRTALRDTLFARLDETYTPRYPQADRLDARDVATAKDALDVLITDGTSHTTHRLGHAMKTVLEQKMDVSSDLPPAEFLRTVIKDYNYVKGQV